MITSKRKFRLGAARPGTARLGGAGQGRVHGRIVRSSRASSFGHFPKLEARLNEADNYKRNGT